MNIIVWRNEMNVHTTLHLDSEMARSLDAEAKARGISRSEMVVFLAHRLMQRYRKMANFLGVVRYQKSNSERQWKRVHIELDPMKYCFMIEMRCFYKSSVSRLIAMELSMLQNGQNINNNNNVTRSVLDNLNFYGRLWIYKKLDMSISWRICWNIPDKPHKL